MSAENCLLGSVLVVLMTGDGWWYRLDCSMIVYIPCHDLTEFHRVVAAPLTAEGYCPFAESGSTHLVWVYLPHCFENCRASSVLMADEHRGCFVLTDDRLPVSYPSPSSQLYLCLHRVWQHLRLWISIITKKEICDLHSDHWLSNLWLLVGLKNLAIAS
jgi:hypothetical protein